MSPARNKTQYRLTPEFQLDARHAIWLPKAGVLAVADLHLGYAWVQRQRGFLFPVGAPDHTLECLRALQKDYQPREIVLLGDIVHRAVAVPALEQTLRELVEELNDKSELVFVLGNHDKELTALLKTWRLPIRAVFERSAGPHLMLHGDDENVTKSTELLQTTRARGGKVIMGHEHPAMVLGDGLASSLKCPCFLVGEEAIILPAFSQWAAGSEFGKHRFMSPLAQSCSFNQAIVVMGDKLLPIPL